jgi:hypothetical protein
MQQKAPGTGLLPGTSEHIGLGATQPWLALVAPIIKLGAQFIHFGPAATQPAKA